MEEDKLRISLIQYDIRWEDKDYNLNYIRKTLAGLSEKTDIVVLPETCTTGFSMNSHNLAEHTDGKTISAIKKWAAEYDLAVCGSYIACEDDRYYNRGFFITAEKEFYYDKHHLFRMGSEPQYFSAGNRQLIFEHKGFNICLLICYDLRFPVWARNAGNKYDLLIYVANWPQSRSFVWKTLLTARAIENMAYVCGVNRIGYDGNGLAHNGDSKLIDAKGHEITKIHPDKEQIETVTISKKELEEFRNKFPVWMDADKFELKG